MVSRSAIVFGVLLQGVTVPGLAEVELRFGFETAQEVEGLSYAEEEVEADELPVGRLLHSARALAGAGSLEIRKVANGIARADARTPCFRGGGGETVTLVGAKMGSPGYSCAFALFAYEEEDCTDEPAISWRDSGDDSMWVTLTWSEALPANRPNYRFGMWASGTAPGSCFFDEVIFRGPGPVADIPAVSASGLLMLGLIVLTCALRRIASAPRR